MKSTKGYKRNSNKTPSEVPCAAVCGERGGLVTLRFLDSTTDRSTSAFRVNMTKDEAITLSHNLLESARSIET